MKTNTAASRPDKKEVVITGVGVVSPIGTGKDSFCSALYKGTSGIDHITLFDASRFPTTFAGEVRGFDPETLLAGTEVLKATRERRVLMAAGAARQAVDDAGITADDMAEGKGGVILGAGVHPVIPEINRLMSSGIYPHLFDDDSPEVEKFEHFVEEDGSGENRVYPIYNRANGGTLAVARQYRIAGPSHTVISACAAATQAMGEAYHLIERGELDIALSGGYDSMVFNFGVYAFCLLGLMSTCNENPATAMKPFDLKRDGFALGEGAGVLVFEEKERALKRGATIYAEVAGYGASVDAYKVTDPHPEGTGAAIAMEKALSDAGMRPEEIDYINAHGTATPKNDRIETMAIKKVFGKHAYSVAVSSTKSMIGHLMAAGGALELIATLLGMDTGFIHPTINYETPDPHCDLDYVPNKAREVDFSTALSNSFGLGGQNGSIIVRKPR